LADDSAMQESLYAPDDPILQLTYKDFNESIYHQKKAFFVEFYSSWCGHCIAFAPLWKELAKNVVGWKKVVQIAAVNCALESNFGLCQEHNLEGYPTLKYYSYESTGPADGQIYNGPRETAADMAAGIASMVSADYEKRKPESWPDFTLAHDNKPGENLWHHDTHYLVLVFETYPATVPPAGGKETPPSIGAQALLDFMDAPGVLIRRGTSRHQLARAHDMTNFPGLLIFSRSHQGEPSYVSKEALKRNDVMLKIKHNTDLASKEYAKQKSGQKVDNSDVDWSKRYSVHYTDLLSAITYTFTHEVPMNKRITGDKLTALKQFLETLTRYFPGPQPMQRLLFRLISWLNEKTDVVASDEWLSQLNKIQEELGRPLSPNVSWVACKGSSAKYRGYPCSMWTLFHVLTVEAYKKDGQRRDFKPLEILESIRGYLKSFFGCRQCVENFEKSASHLSTNVKKPSDVVLWLWKAHNTANDFLKGDPSEDPESPKQQFPPKGFCSYCYHQDGTFDESGVLEFLIKYYSNIKAYHKSYLYDKIDSKSGGKGEEESLDVVNSKFRTMSWDKLVEDERSQKIKELEDRFKPKYDRHWNNETSDRAAFFNGFDLSLCFFVWLASVALVCLFCAYAKYRKGRHRFWKTFYGDLKV